MGLGFWQHYRARNASRFQSIKETNSKKDFIPTDKSSGLGKDSVLGIFEHIHSGGRLSYEHRTVLLHQIDNWMASDVVACLNYLNSNSALGLLERSSVLAAIEKATHGSVLECLTLSSQIENGALRDELNTIFYKRLVDTSPESALEYFERLPIHLSDSLGLYLAQAWTKTTGRTAVEAIIQRPNIPESVEIAALTTLSESDPEAAISLLMDTPDSAFRARSDRSLGKVAYLNSILNASVPPDVAMRLLAKLPPSGLKDQKMAEVYARIFANNPAQGEQALAQTGIAIPTVQVLVGAVQVAAASSPASAQEILKLIPGEGARAEAVAGAAIKLCDKSPTKALEWADKIESPLTRMKGFEAIANQWMSKSPADAVAYAISEAGNGDDSFLVAVLKEVKASDHDDYLGPKYSERLSGEIKQRLRSAINSTSAADPELLRLLR